MPDRVILIDGDILVYQSAQNAEKETDWGAGLWTLHAWEDEAKCQLNDMIFGLQEVLGADRVILALTDPVNWRLSVLPTYKGNRAGKRKPMLIPALRRWITEDPDFEVFQRPNLEGDDVLGILATHKHLVKGEKVIVSLDKDMKTIPGFHYNQGKPDQQIFEVTPAEADDWHMIQTLAGDQTDGYSGCPGLGLAKATRAVKERICLVPFEHTIKRGARKGQTEVRFEERPAEALWDVVTSHYQAAGLGEEEALRQARVARICRASDYDFKTKEVKLWTP